MKVDYGSGDLSIKKPSCDICPFSHEVAGLLMRNVLKGEVLVNIIPSFFSLGRNKTTLTVFIRGGSVAPYWLNNRLPK